MEFKFIVTAKTKKTVGPAAGREEVAEEIRVYLDEDSNPGTLYIDDTEYEVTSWEVREA